MKRNFSPPNFPPLYFSPYFKIKEYFLAWTKFRKLILTHFHTFIYREKNLEFFSIVEFGMEKR